MNVRLAILAAWLLAGVVGVRAETVSLIKVTGAIGPATAGYISRAIDVAEKDGSQCLVVQLDTPGGLLESTKVIVQRMLAARVPVVVYVAPSGASAGSAGCFITLAADVAAMAPTTNIGAAHPVDLAGGGGDGGEKKGDDVMSKKIESYASSYIEAIAAKRKRNVEWARSSVKESASITAAQALEKNVIEIIAADVPDLLRQLDGRKVGERTLSTAGAKVVEIPATLRERVFHALWRPEVLFVLMLIAIYGIIGELSNPGAIIPGVAGGIALILALYMAAVLPINLAGLALIGLAIALFIADIFTPTHGVLTVGGIAAFFIGALMLFETPEPTFRLSLAYIIAGTVLTAGFFAFIVGAGLRAQLWPVKVGRETMLGATAKAVAPINPAGGKVFLEGEYWNAVSDQPIAEGQPVEIVRIDGLKLTVRAKTS
ncbi:MAG: nodulation protein NfeD [Chthoniobacteraceae bacterium]